MHIFFVSFQLAVVGILWSGPFHATRVFFAYYTLQAPFIEQLIMHPFLQLRLIYT